MSEGLGLAPGGNRHMKVVKLGGHYTVNLFEAEKVNGHCPSVDVLFRSVANTVKGDAVGIILTGMGQDGAYGLLEMRKAGGRSSSSKTVQPVVVNPATDSK